jgi:methylenetetrahydrofolate--tRNA-(uracil-5-)-methyltransferase
MSSEPVHIVGGGLAGSECAHQLARHGVAVVLHEMRPERSTPAHKTGDLAEMVCSNSFRSDDPEHAAGLLKREMEAFDSLILRAARAVSVPAGGALAVDRHQFASSVTETIGNHPLIEIRRQEVLQIPDGDAVLATGPLTSPAISSALLEILGDEHLYFYDSIAPIVSGDSLDHSRLFWGSRYGKGDGDDYLNAAMSRQEYEAFYEALLAADVVPLHDFEQALFFEGCLPVEEIARRGIDTLRFGPMKPVGLTPPDDSRPHAVVQLRQENLAKSHFNLVGFQSRLKWGEQKRVFSMIPGLGNADFVRLGQVHRNTFVNAPTHLNRFYRLNARPRLRLAGQITGVEGYLESAATGLAIGLYIALERRGVSAEPFPGTTAIGALSRHLVDSKARHFQPANINYGLFPEIFDPANGRPIRKRERRAALAARARADLAAWIETHDLDAPTATTV